MNAVTVDEPIMPIDTADLSWAKPDLDAAREQIAHGESVDYSEFKRELAERIESLQRSL